MATHTWSEIKAKKFTAEQSQQVDDAVKQELLEMDLRALCTGQDEGEMTIFTAKVQRGKEAGGSLVSLLLCAFPSLL